MEPLMLMLNLSIVLVMAVQVNFYFNSVFGKERSKPTKWKYILAFLIINVLYLTAPFSLLWSNLLYVTVIFCLSLGYEAELRMKLVFSVLYAVLLTLVNTLCLYLLDPSLSVALDNAYTSNNGDQMLYGRALLISCIIMFAVIQVIRFFSKRRSYPLSLRYYLLFLSVPAISIYQVNVLTIYSEKNINYFLSVFGFIILNVLVVYILDTVMARFQLLHENTQLQLQMDYQDANYEKTVHSFKKSKASFTTLTSTCYISKNASVGA